MTQTCETPPGMAGFADSSFPGGNIRESAPNSAPNQAEILRDPAAVREARLWLIREDLYGDLDEIRIFAERGLRALEVENDLDLGRAFDRSVKHFSAVAANLKALVLVKTGAPL
jgi:hypothetical protein